MENEIKHIHSFTSTVVPPTCINNGYTLHKCECGYEHKDSFLPQTDHSYTVTESTPPTCTMSGTSKYVCTVCGVEKIITVAPVGHRWGEWNTNAFATCTENGSRFHICSQCGCVEEQVIEATGHNLTNPQKSETEKGMVDYFCTSCGQTVTMPSTKTKSKKFGTKKIIKILVAVVSLIALILCMKPIIIPGYHYISAKMHISSENYEKAYFHLKKCDKFKSTKILLQDFYVAYEKEIKYNYDEEGELSSKHVYKNDELGNTLTSKSYYDDFDEPSYEYEYDRDYEYNSNGNLIKSTTYNSDGEIIVITTFDYYEDGYSLHYISYSDYKNDEKDHETKSEYDIFGNLIFNSEQRYDAEEGEDSYTETRYEYEYRGNGTMISVVQYTDDEKVYSAECDEYGNPVKLTNYGDEKETIKIKYEYDKDGNVEVASAKYDGITRKLKLEYDEYGNVTKRTEYEDGELSYRYKYEYDDTGYLIKESRYDGEDNTLDYVIEYEEPFVVYLPKR